MGVKSVYVTVRLPAGQTRSVAYDLAEESGYFMDSGFEAIRRYVPGERLIARAVVLVGRCGTDPSRFKEVRSEFSEVFAFR
jgi:hypothetical protein